MSLSRRDRRNWRIFLWFSLTSAVVSAYFGYSVRPPDTIRDGGDVRRRRDLADHCDADRCSLSSAVSELLSCVD